MKRVWYVIADSWGKRVVDEEEHMVVEHLAARRVW